jgi:mono/diheme cytochrome c family protein
MRMRTYPATLLCALVACSLATGCRASAPGKKETATMDWIKRNITVKGKHDRNPLQQSPAVIADGKTAFNDYCTVCHGLDGQNTGVPFADNMAPPVPSLASQNVQRYTDGQLKWIIENGIEPSGMPASRGILSDEEMWSIVEFLRHLPPAGSLGEPRVYSGDDSDAGHP